MSYCEVSDCPESKTTALESHVGGWIPPDPPGSRTTTNRFSSHPERAGSMKCHSTHQTGFPNRSRSNLYHSSSQCHVPGADFNFRDKGKPFFFSSGQDLYRDHVTPSHESGYHSSGGYENGFHSLGRESRCDRSCPGMCRSESRNGINSNRGHRDRDYSISRVESRVGVLHADRRAGYFQKDFSSSFPYDRERVGSGGLVHSSTHDHSLSRPESRTGGIHHSSSVHEHCTTRSDSCNHDHSRPESRCAHDRPESRGPPPPHPLCPEHSRAGLIHSSSSGFESGFSDRVQMSLGLHQSSSRHDSLQLSSSTTEGYSEPAFHSSEVERFSERPHFRAHDFHSHPGQKLIDSPFRLSCPVHSPYRFRFVNGGPDFFGQQSDACV
ncbi:hypothetical protein RUM43_002010 [Polyplax serrata]|uniref:Uncharacterized protein n=1 Tax=Polyplax serrata TaxID=468196 RepID=A0AAN8PBY8_POLSC